MLKDITYSQKLTMLKSWINTIIEEIKKDVKQEHLKYDREFTKTYFSSANITKLTANELAVGYVQAIEKNDRVEELGEFLANRWLLKNSDMYEHFEEKLRQISPNFTELEVLEEKDAIKLMQDSINEFGAIKTYLFSVLNSVVFPETILKELQHKAIDEKKTEEENREKAITETEEKNKEKFYQQQIARLTDKYEKRILGLEKKYHIDIATLKKQISTLQKKLESK